MAMPVKIEARLVSSATGVVAARRSTRGCAARNSHVAHASSATADSPNAPRMAHDVQPHTEPCDSAMRNDDRPTASNSAPTASNR